MKKKFINKKKNKLKKMFLELNKEDKIIVKLPQELWKDEEKLKSVMKKLSVINYEDISIEFFKYYDRYKSFQYILCVHDYLRFEFIERSNGDLEYNQLTFKGE